MPDQRVSIFISHKVAIHQRAAARIKTILEARAECLDVHISEDIPAGDRWREWIAAQIAHSQLLLVLVPRGAMDLGWIGDEIGRFEAACPAGHLVVLKFPSDPVPDVVRDRQIVEISTDRLESLFLRPLFLGTTLTGLAAPLNGRVTDDDLTCDAKAIEEALRGMANLRVESFGESLIVETIDVDVTAPDGLATARVQAPNGCGDILNWNCRLCSWDELRTRAAEKKGKGTFWISEMEEVIVDVARQNPRRVMTSTFRGRGRAAGQIFRPQLEQVDYVDETPVRYHFTFHEVLVPELVRGQGDIGDVFNLLYIATRVRWEVLNPFLVNVSLAKDTPPSRLDLSREEEHDLVSRVRTSLQLIECEAERHQMLEVSLNALDESDRTLAIHLLKKREWIRNAIEASANSTDFPQFMDNLAEGLAFNCEAMEVLSTRFLQLVHEDRLKVQQMLQRLSSNNVQAT